VASEPYYLLYTAIPDLWALNYQGHPTLDAFFGVSEQASNLSISLPERTPQKSAALDKLSLTRFITNSFEPFIIS
jgi:hypothetical protein